MFSDLKYALRQMAKNPGFVAVAVLTLGLGIGANTAVFSVINTMTLKALPVKDPGRLVVVAKKNGPVANQYGFSYPVYDQFRQQARSLSVIGDSTSARGFVAANLGLRQIELILVSQVSGNYFQLLGIPAALGRVLTPEDDQEGNARPVAVVSYGFWQSHFSSDPGVIGKTITIDDVSFSIVGVAPPGFHGLYAGADLNFWLPIHMIPVLDQGVQRLQPNNNAAWLNIMGRLAPGASRQGAQSELDVIYQRKQADTAAMLGAKWSASQRSQFLDSQLDLRAGGAGFSGFAFIKPLILILSTIVGLVFLVACANVASLLLARGASRQRELAVRLALGAGRGRLIRQLLTESVLLAAGGGLLGLVFAQWGVSYLLSYVPSGASLAGLDLRPDAHVLLFMLGASAVTGLLVGLIPAFRFSRLDLISALKSQTQGITGGSRQRLNRSLVVAQIAVTVCLLAGAGLFVRTLEKLKDVDLGFNPKHVLLFTLDLPKSYDAGHRLNLARTELDALRELPGVRSASFALGGLATGASSPLQAFAIDGYVPSPGETTSAYVTAVGPDFFETLSIPLKQGRMIAAKDIFSPRKPAASSSVAPAMINENLARKYFGPGGPIGRRLRLNGTAFEIVGVVHDAKNQNLRENPSFEIYVPYFAVATPPRLPFQIRAAGDPLALAAGIPASLHRIDANVGVRSMRTLNEQVDLSLIQERMIAQLASFFSGLALVLACIGLYGVLAYNVAQRTREIGVRMALGADLGNIIGLVVKQGLRLSATGCIVGLAAAFGLTRLVSSRLYGVSGADPLAFFGAVLVLVLMAVLASWIPARRAAKVDPLIALRAE